MQKKLKHVLFLAAFTLCFLFTALSAWAYEKEDHPIRSVSINIQGYIEVETKFGEEELEILTSGNKYSFDHYDVENIGFRWSIEDTPELKIYLAADEGYYFNIVRASSIRVTGGTYVTATREDSCYTLVVTVKLPPLNTQVSPITETNLTQEGICTWSESIGAGAYEVKFMRNGTTLGGVQTVKELSFDGSRLMTKAAPYHFMVRAVNNVDPSIKGHWVDSNIVYVTDYQADNQKETNKTIQNMGDWEETDGGWYFKLPSGEYVKGEWRYIYEKWYCFDGNGKMRTGWYEEGGKWYYLDPQEGYMCTNAETPDGYRLGIDGTMSVGDNTPKPGT